MSSKKIEKACFNAIKKNREIRLLYENRALSALYVFLGVFLICGGLYMAVSTFNFSNLPDNAFSNNTMIKDGYVKYNYISQSIGVSSLVIGIGVAFCIFGFMSYNKLDRAVERYEKKNTK